MHLTYLHVKKAANIGPCSISSQIFGFISPLSLQYFLHLLQATEVQQEAALLLGCLALCGAYKDQFGIITLLKKLTS